MSLDHHDEELIQIVLRSIKKNEEVTRNKLHERGPIDYRTVEHHLQHIVGKDLGDGTRIVKGKACHPALIRDPRQPGELVIEEDAYLESEDSSWKDFAVGAILGAVATGLTIMIGSAIQASRKHTCSWTCVTAENPWFQVCPTCGAVRQWNLNDPNSPIHFVPVPDVFNPESAHSSIMTVS